MCRPSRSVCCSPACYSLKIIACITYRVSTVWIQAVVCSTAGMDQRLPQEMSRYCWTWVRDIWTTGCTQLAAAWNRATCLTTSFPLMSFLLSHIPLGCWTLHHLSQSICRYFVHCFRLKFSFGCIVRIFYMFSKAAQFYVELFCVVAYGRNIFQFAYILKKCPP